MSEFLDTLPAEGAVCPCCRQFSKVYRRKLNSTMARCLIWLSRQSDEWIDVQHLAPRHVVAAAGELAKLVHWGLAETRTSEDTRKRMSGMWRPTVAGVAFANDQTRAPSHAIIYDGELLRLEGKLIGIRDALGSHFDYAELMR